MASLEFLYSLKLITSFLLLLLLTTTIVADSEPRRRCYKSIISFGDSMADTGNLLRLSEHNHIPQSAFPPYGETFFGSPTGRFSDGRLIVDFIAEFLGLPLVLPYFGSQNGSFEKGVNFAVGGATALDNAFLETKGIHFNLTNVSLGVQLSVFKELLPSLCGSSSDCSEFLSNSLILMGEIGGNDINYAFFAPRSIQETKELVPLVISVISSAILDLVELGGNTFLVPGNFPIGCSARYLTKFETADKEEYDPLTGCLTWLNEFAEYYNEQLQVELNRLRKLYPYVNIIYADYYNVVLRFYQEPTKYGFKNRSLAACCGVGGAYNFSLGKLCGVGAPYCDNPSEYVNWDGIHFTEAAYRLITEGLLEGPYADPAFNSSCFNSKLQNGSSDNTTSSI